MKPLRLRDIQGNSKAVIDIYWSDLKGNKSPYLSVSIVEVKVEGVRLYCHKEQLEAIRTQFNCDFYILLKNHLSNKSGLTLHQESNSYYFYQQTKEHFIREIQGFYTVEQKQKDIEGIKQKVINDLDEIIQGKHVATIQEYRKRLLLDLENYNYTRQSRIDNLAECLSKIGKNFVIINNFIKWSEGFKEAKKKLQIIDKQLTVDTKEAWTVKRLSNYLELSEETIKEMLLKPLTKEEFNLYIEPQIEQNKIDLLDLDKKLNIPTIEG